MNSLQLTPRTRQGQADRTADKATDKATDKAKDKATDKADKVTELEKECKVLSAKVEQQQADLKEMIASLQQALWQIAELSERIHHLEDGLSSIQLDVADLKDLALEVRFSILSLHFGIIWIWFAVSSRPRCYSHPKRAGRRPVRVC